MDDDFQEEFDKWIEIAKRLGLIEWQIELHRDDLPDDVLARCFIPKARQFARITIGDAFEEADEDEKHSTRVHELLHCHFNQIGEIASEALPQLLGDPAYCVFEAALDLAIERALDAIAVPVADLLSPAPEGE